MTLQITDDITVVELVNGTWEACLDALGARARGTTREDALFNMPQAITAALNALPDAERIAFVLASTTDIGEGCPL